MPSSPLKSQQTGTTAGAESGRREFTFSNQDFDRVRKLIHTHAGISLGEQKQEMVYSRLARRLRALDIDSFREYLDRLESAGGDEWELFTNALTTNLTSFFREAHHFPVLAERLKAHRHREPISIWCAASSTGEEPYSLAMTLVETLGSWTPQAHILATDVDTTVLARAQEAIYPVDRLEKMPQEQVRRFFQRGTGSQSGAARARKELRDLITFRRLNLLDSSWPVRGPFDAIFCRNVLIYFDKPTQRRILERFRPLLRPDGLLFVGHSEGLFHCADLFRLRGKTVYDPVAAPGTKPA
jgi:chemotaxis protein methyltransferase CheR